MKDTKLGLAFCLFYTLLVNAPQKKSLLIERPLLTIDHTNAPSGVFVYQLFPVLDYDLFTGEERSKST